MRVYLASGSPRRKEIVTQRGVEGEGGDSGGDEHCDLTDPAMMVEELSGRKAFAVADELKAEGVQDYCVIGADTVVALDGEILGKPKDSADAIRMLRELSGRSHDVFTGVTIVYPGEVRIFNERTKVYFSEMTDEEIEEYVSTGDPLDKAGAYGIQGFCARYIKGIEGDYNNVVGLPVGRLYREMRK